MELNSQTHYLYSVCEDFRSAIAVIHDTDNNGTEEYKVTGEHAKLVTSIILVCQLGGPKYKRWDAREIAKAVFQIETFVHNFLVKREMVLEIYKIVEESRGPDRGDLKNKVFELLN